MYCYVCYHNIEDHIKLTNANADPEGGDDLFDEVERVRCDGGVGDGDAMVECHYVTLGQPSAQLPQHLLVPVFAEPYHLTNGGHRFHFSYVIFFVNY